MQWNLQTMRYTEDEGQSVVGAITASGAEGNDTGHWHGVVESPWRLSWKRLIPIQLLVVTVTYIS